MTDRLRAGLADLAETATPVDLRERVYRGARRIARRNRTLGAMTGLALVAGSVAGYTMLWPTAGVGPQLGATTGLTPDPTGEVDPRNATFTVPAYPGVWAHACPEGERTFTNGLADVGPGAKLMIAEDVLRGDLDGAPGDEFVLRVQCATEGGSDLNLLAVRVGSDGAVTALGWVNVDADGELLVLDRAEPVEVRDGSVRVVVIKRYDDWARDKQVRRYAYRDGRMVQIDGPTSFPPVPTDPTAVDLRTMTLFVNTSWWMDPSAISYSGYAKLVDGTANGHLEKIVNNTTAGFVPATVTVLETALVSAGDHQAPVAVFEVAPADGPARVVVTAYHPWEGYVVQEPWNVYVAAPGETIESITPGPGQLTIVTSSGAHTFRYNPDPAGPRWVEVGFDEGLTDGP